MRFLDNGPHGRKHVGFLLQIFGGVCGGGGLTATLHIAWFLFLLQYFSIDNAHLMYNAHPKLFRHFFYV
jgi:hypothetical protein